MSNVSRCIVLATQTGQLRTERFEDREHLVVPVVMLLEGVVFAGNSARPELVLEEELHRSLRGWDGRPVVGGHPTRHGTPIGANDPLTLGMERFGHVFNARMDGKRLCAEAWIDPVKAAKPGAISERVLARIKEGTDILEVSVGVWARSEDAQGTYNGVPYGGIWRDVVPDHLAMLAEGDRGACSVDMGCGAMRAATIHIVTAQGMQAITVRDNEMPNEDAEVKPRSLKERLKGLWEGLRAAAVEDMTDNSIHRSLDKALLASEPAYLGIEDVSSKGDWVVFAAMPAGALQFFRRSFTAADDGSITLGDEREEVRTVQEYQPVAASAAEPKTACGCSGHSTPNNAAATAAGENTMDKAQKIAALLGSKKLGPGLTEKFLNTLSDEQIAAIEIDVEAAAAVTIETTAVIPPVVVPAVVAPAVLTSASAQTAEQFISSAPSELQDSLRDGLRIARERRESLIKTLKDTGRCAFTDADFSGFSNDKLNQLVALADVKPTLVVDYSGRGLSRPSVVDEDVTAPPDQIALIQAAAKK